MDLFPVKDSNWKLVDTDNKHEGWIKSWRDMVGLPKHMEHFLNHLLVWPSYPVLWLADDATRTEAPLFFIVAHHGRKIAAQSCCVQFVLQQLLTQQNNQQKVPEVTEVKKEEPPALPVPEKEKKSRLRKRSCGRSA